MARAHIRNYPIYFPPVPSQGTLPCRFFLTFFILFICVFYKCVRTSWAKNFLLWVLSPHSFSFINYESSTYCVQGVLLCTGDMRRPVPAPSGLRGQMKEVNK